MKNETSNCFEESIVRMEEWFNITFDLFSSQIADNAEQGWYTSENKANKRKTTVYLNQSNNFGTKASIYI